MSSAEQFDEFVAAYGSRLVRTAYLLTGNWADAEDAVQSALLGCYRRWRRVDVHLDPAGYVYRSIVNATIDLRRRPWRREVLSDETYDSADADRSEAVADRLDLLAALQSLPARQRAAVVLRFWDDLSVRQVAELLDCPGETVRTHTARGLEHLRRVVRNPEGQESK